MNKICGFCNKELPIRKQQNNRVNIFVCESCQKPKFNTMYRQTYRSEDDLLQYVSIFVDDFYVLYGYYLLGPTTTIYKSPVGVIYESADPGPITWDWERPAFSLIGILELPLQDPALVKKKLEIYTLFS